MSPPAQNSAPKGMANITAYCIPSFLLMISGEMAMSWFYGDIKKIYRVNDTINSISLGMVQQMFGSIIAPFAIAKYRQLYKYRLFDVPNTWISVVGITLFADFLYYWAHRLGHEFNWMWAAHSIHHSSENFNYSTALRQAAFQIVTNMWISLYPAAILGIPFDIYEFHRSLNVVMQFWIHTQYCKDLGAIEYIFNTPAQHIIHHSRAPGHCNKNYAGWFSIWDQLFGTLEMNYRPKKFGIIEQHYTWDPVVINLKNYKLLFKRMMKYDTFKGKIKWLFSSARFVYDGGINDPKELAKLIRYNPILSNVQTTYCVGMFGISLFEYVVKMVDGSNKGYMNKVLSGLYLALSLSSLAQFMNKSKLGRFTETIKWILIMGILCGDRFIGKDKLSLIFDDSNYNIARLFSCSIGVVISKLNNNKYKSIASLGIMVFALWSLKSVLLDSNEEEDEKEQKMGHCNF